MYYIYKACTNDPIITTEPLNDCDLVCSVCGKLAEFIASAATIEEVAAAVNNSNMTFSHYAQEEIESMFDGCLHYDSVCGIIVETKEKLGSNA